MRIESLCCWKREEKVDSASLLNGIFLERKRQRNKNYKREYEFSNGLFSLDFEEKDLFVL